MELFIEMFVVWNAVHKISDFRGSLILLIKKLEAMSNIVSEQ